MHASPRWFAFAGLLTIATGLTFAPDANAFWGHRRVVTSYSVPSVPVVAAPAAVYRPVVVAPVVSAPVTVSRPVITAAPVTTFYAPPTTTYYAPPTTTYYAPPVTTYYAPTATYYAPPVTTYYAPSAVVGATPTLSTTVVQRPILRPRVTTTYSFTPSVVYPAPVIVP
jgi:hypothetical protein